MNDQSIKSVPNQRIITVKKEPTDKEHLYACINVDAMMSAMADLRTKAGFKMWIYFAKNQPDYSFALSSLHFVIQSQCGMDAYRSAFTELLNKGYLEQASEGSNRYYFYEKPIKKNEKIPTYLDF